MTATDGYDRVLALLVDYEDRDSEFKKPPFDGMRTVVESHRPQTRANFDAANGLHDDDDAGTDALICAWCGTRRYPCEVIEAIAWGLSATLGELPPDW